MPEAYYLFWSAVVAITLLANAVGLYFIATRLGCRCPCHTAERTTHG